VGSGQLAEARGKEDLAEGLALQKASFLLGAGYPKTIGSC